MIAALKSFVATVVGTTLLVVWTLLFSLVVIVAAAVGGERVADSAIRLWARLVTLSSGVRVEVSGAESLAGVGPCVVMANHTSLFDIPALILAAPRPIRFLAKRELFRLPVLGWALGAAGFVCVDRGRSRGGATAFAAARRALDAGTSLAIFPEETRSTDGELLPFRGGGALLAAATGVPVVPVGIRGAFEIRPRDRRAIHPGTISVHYGQAIDPGDFDNRKQLNDAVREQIGRLIAEPAKEEPQGTA